MPEEIEKPTVKSQFQTHVSVLGGRVSLLLKKLRMTDNKIEDVIAQGWLKSQSSSVFIS